MASSTSKSFLRGVRDAAPFILVLCPFALIFGVVATEAGLAVAQIMGFSILIIAGAAQFAAVQLIENGAPTLVVLATALAVNLRMAMYSASLAPHLGAAPLWQRALAAYCLTDQTYAVAISRYEAEPAMPVPDRVAFYFGAGVTVAPFWYGFTYLGAVGGTAIPPGWGLDFALPLMFIALVAPMLRTLAHFAAAATSVALAILFAPLPAGLGLLLAGGAAMVVGATTETWAQRRQAWR